jgi:adenylate cyclase class IV
MTTIEIEHRSLITEQDFLRLREFLNSNAENLGNDNKDTFFYVWSDKVIKVVENKETGKAKMVLKPGRLHKQSHFHESELTILAAEVEQAKIFCESLEPEKIMRAYQFRTNYKFKGVELALKYTQSFGFHMELEVMVDDLSKKPEAEQQIENVARELDIKLLNDEDLKKLTVELEGGMNYGEYTNENFPY